MATATATILFSDVEGSTEVRAQIGEASADRLFVEHERLMVSVVERRSGRVLKKAGDGVMAAFDSASDAVQAAIDMQRTVARREELRIRVGIAAGDVSWESDDVFGLPVVLAARLETAAAPGQILISQVVRWLAGDRSDATFEGVEDLDLKGFPEPVAAFSVSWEPSPEEEAAAESVPLPPSLAMHAGGAFVGRDTEWETLSSAWREARAGSRRTVLLGGEPGAGKTRLAAEFARQCHHEGAAVLFGGCDADLLVPYQPWVQALEHLLRTVPLDQLAPDVVSDLAVLHPLLPRLDRPATPRPIPAFVDSNAERYRLFAAFDELLIDAARRWPLVVVVDDLHWGGVQTLGLLSHVARNRAEGPTLIIGTFRDTGDDLGEDLASVLADLRRVDAVARLRIGGLDEPSVASLVEDATGQDLDDDLRQLAAEVALRSRGNAFFVGELWRHLIATGTVARVAGRWEARGSLVDAGVPDSVREVVADRLSRLEFSSRRVSELIAIGGGRLELPVVRAASDMAESDITTRLDELVAVGLLEAVTRPRLTYQFTHAIVRDTVEAGMPAGARAQLHLRVGEALEAAHEGDHRPVATELAHHFSEAAALGASGKAVYYCRRAAEQAMMSLAYEAAAEHLDTALDHTTPGSETRAEVLLSLGESLASLNRFERARAVYTQAFELGRELKNTRLAGEAAIGFEDALQTPGLPGEPAVEIVGEAIKMLGDDGSALRARLEAAYAEALHMAGRTDEAFARLDSALELADQADDDGARMVALEAAIIMYSQPDRVLEYGEKLEIVATRNASTWALLYVTVNRCRAYVTLGQLDDARVELERHRPMAERISVVLARVETCVFDHILSMAAGRLAESEAFAEEGFEAAAETHPSAPGVYGMQMFAIRREQGRLAEVRPILDAVSRQTEAGGAWRPALAMLYAEAGMLDEARVQFEALAIDDFSSIPHDSVWPASVSFLADTAIALGDAERAAILFRQMLPVAGLTLQVGLTTCLGPADRLLGGLAATSGQHQLADQHYEAAIALSDRAASPVWRARALHDWARALAARGERARATPLLDEALAVAEHLGMAALAQSCRKLLSNPPLLRVVPAVEERTQAWPSQLSGREVDVLRLVAQGRSNREIGETLTISANTAANHVRSILQKTGCSNRAEAAAFATRNDLV